MDYDKEIDRILKSNLAKADKELVKIYRDTLIDLKKQVKTAIKNYENLTPNQKAIVRRNKKIIKDLDNQLAAMTDRVNEVITNHKTKSLNDGYGTLFFKLEGQNDLDLPFTPLPLDAVRASVLSPVAGKTLSQRLYRNRQKLAKFVNNEVTSGIIKGDSYAEVAGRLDMLTEADYKKAFRIARTEGGRMFSMGNQKACEDADDLGLDVKKVWISALDNRTRSSHQELDGQIVGAREEFVSPSGNKALQPRMFGDAAEDINCRCTASQTVGNRPPKYRRDGDGNVMKYKTYKDWVRSKNTPNFQNVHQNGFKKYTSKELKEIARRTKEIADKHLPSIESKWSGKLVIDPEHGLTAKLWNCDICCMSECAPHMLLHEQIHAKSISYFDRSTYKEFGNMEEASVELFSEEICKLESMPIIESQYKEMVSSLVSINNFLGNDDLYTFSKKLISQPLPERINYLEGLIYDKMIREGSIEEYQKLDKLLEKVR